MTFITLALLCIMTQAILWTFNDRSSGRIRNYESQKSFHRIALECEVTYSLASSNVADLDKKIEKERTNQKIIFTTRAVLLVLAFVFICIHISGQYGVVS